MTRATRVAIGIASLLAIAGSAAWKLPHKAARHPTEPNITLNVEKLTLAAITTQPAETPTAASPPPADLLSVLKLDNPAWANAAPLDLPTDLMDAAKIVLHHPAYVDPLGNLWITHPHGRPMSEVLAGAIADHTAVVRERVRYVHWPADGGQGGGQVQGGPAAAIVDDASGTTCVAVTAAGVRSSAGASDFRFADALPIGGGIVVPDAGGATALLNTALPRDLQFRFPHAVALKNPEGPTPPPLPHSAGVLASTGDTVFIWCPWETGKVGSESVIQVRGDGTVDPLDVEQGWPPHVREIIPLADNSVLVLYDGDDGPALKMIQGKEKPPSTELTRTITAFARQLADPEPLTRDAATRALEAQGPAAYPVLESLREQLPAEAQVRVENLLGQRFAPTLGGLRPGPGKVRTLARFPGGGCVLHFDGGGTVGGIDENDPPRSVIPATVLIRPGHSIELIDPKAVTDFVAGRQTIQAVGEELIVSDPNVGPRRWIGLTLLPPLLPKELADFDTVVAIDARRRWLLRSSKRPGDTLLIDPTLPDPTPQLPVWTINAPNGAGRTDEGWPAVRHGEEALVLGRAGWRSEKLAVMRDQWVELPAIFDRSGRQYLVDRRIVHVTGRDGLSGRVVVPGDGASEVRVAVDRGRLFAYSAEGSVHRYAITANATGPTLTPEATFTAGVPTNADRVWIDPAGRLVMRSPERLAIGFIDGRVPAALRDVMLRVTR